MWIFPRSTSSDSSPASADSNAASSPDSETWASMLASSAWWRGSRSEPRVWLRRCAEATWLRALSGSATCGSSPLPPTLERWISSVRASPASLLPPPGSAAAPTTSVGFGPRLSEWRASLGLATSSVRTSADSSVSTPARASRRSSRGWPTSGSMRSGRCSPRPPLELLTDASGCSSSGGGEMWMTPCAAEAVGRSQSEAATEMGFKPTLCDQAAMWPTATRQDGASSGGRNETAERTGNTHPGTSLTDAINLWATPRLWTTPQAHDTTKRGAGNRMNPGGGAACLATDAEMWATPTSHERTHAPRAVDHGVQLANQVASLNLGPPAPASATDGPNSSPPTPGSPRPFQPNGRSESPSGGTDSSESPKAKLNPTFVEWMMNVPRGWTDPTTWGSTPTDSSPSRPPSPTAPGSHSSHAPKGFRIGGTSAITAPASASDAPASSSGLPGPTKVMWPTPSAGDSESGQSKPSLNARRGGGDSRLRVAASQFEVPKPATDPRAWTGSEPSATPSSPRRHEPLSPDSGAGSTPNL